jgi:hypothetical protein
MEAIEKVARSENAVVTSVPDFIRRVLDYTDSEGLAYGNLWFRGVKDLGFGLEPGTVWRKRIRADIDESVLIDEFLVSLPGYVHEAQDDPWNLYALMQHYSVPTRLLDWSKSPLAAMFFALDFDETKEHVSPCVWTLNPYALNKASVGESSVFFPRTKFGLDKDAVLVNRYLPATFRPKGQESDELPDLPVAIEPSFSNRRILAQQGCFTVHGKSDRSIEGVAPSAVNKILLSDDPNVQHNLRTELEQLGYRAEWLYQDVDRLARRIIRERCDALVSE